ncbi:MAG TPA: choice-of-anchor D domain-containing protein [Verrucomicrobiae bacterium]|nr:choice-of-anchor D domain-containing protein [Verrucomicrobiae bacterium]
MKNSPCFRFLALWILGVSVLSTGTVVLGQLASSHKSKIVIYPSANEPISQAQNLGISHVINYGSYWLAEVTDDQMASVKARYGERVVKADSMNHIHLNVCRIDVSQGEPSNIPDGLRESIPSGNRLRLVQFRGPVKPQWLQQLQGVGDVKIVSYVPNNAYVVWVDAAAEANLHRLTASNGPVQWISAYHPYYKAKPSLLHTTNAVVNVTVELVDTPQLPQSLGEIRGLCLGGKCGEPTRVGGRIQIQATLPATGLLPVVRLPDVLWVQQIVPTRRMDENQAIVLATGSNGLAPTRYLNFLNAIGFPDDPSEYPILDIADTGLDEPSETTGIYPWHPCFYDPAFPVSPDAQCDPSTSSRVVYATDSDTEGHGTVVASVAAGYDLDPNQTIHCFTQSNDVVTVNGNQQNVCVPLEDQSRPFPATVFRRSGGLQCGLGVSPYGRIGSSPGGAQGDYPGAMTAGLRAYLSGARISNNSWGEILVTGVNGGAYDASSQDYDSLVRDAVQTGSTNPPTPGYSPVNQELFYVFAGGNANGADLTVGGFGDVIVTPPATAKNVIAVGASTLDDGMSSFSSFGPCEDGRFKPDIVAPGEGILGATSQATYTHPDCDGCDPNNPSPAVCSQDVVSDPVITRLYGEVDNGITAYAGTSFSAPAVSGGAQLLWWYFQNRLLMLPPSPAMLKAYLCNSALYLPIIDPLTGAQDTLPSIAQGMGRMDLSRMFDGVSRVLRDETTPRAIDTPLLGTNAVSQQTFFSQSGQTYQLSGTVADTSQPFRVTLAWTDAPGNPAAFNQLVNDLNLKVTIGGKLYLGNVFAGPNSVPGGVLDQVNNMESVFLPAGQTGAWSVVVQAQDIAGPAVPNVKGSVVNQDFALVVYNGANASDVSMGLTNDICQTAIPIMAFPFSWTNTLSSPTYVNAAPSPSAGPGGLKEFFRIVRPIPGTIISANTTGSAFPTEVSIWEGQCGALFELTSDAPSLTIPPVPPSVSWTVTDTNNMYYIVAEGFGGATGHLVLNVDAQVPAIEFLPSSLNFGATYPFTTTAPQLVTFTNGSTLAVNINDISVVGADPGDFQIIANQCAGTTVPPGGICQIELVFEPTATGTRTAALQLLSDTTGASQLLPLSGTGLVASPLVCLSSGNLAFGNQFVGTTSLVQSIVVSNCGAAALVVTNHVLTGANAGDFTLTGYDCESASIPPGGVCTGSVSFAPSGTGARAATLILYDNAVNNPHSIGFSGTGVVPAPGACYSAGSLSFGNVHVGNNALQTLTVTNCGTVALLITNVSLTGTDAAQFAVVGNTCASVPAGGTCSISVRFTPASGGTFTASLMVFDNVAGSPQAISLSGNSVSALPDALIGTSTSVKKLVGNGVLDPTGASQTIYTTINNGKKKVFYVAIQNLGSASDSFVVTGGGSTPQFTVSYYLGTAKNATNITDAVVAGTYTTPSMAAGAMTAKNAMIRVQIQANDVPTSTSYDIPVTVSSVSVPSLSDRVIVSAF